ncbi:hypothetical protein SUDANB120_05172 [Streptomyces sp. enrichment culture]
MTRGEQGQPYGDDAARRPLTEFLARAGVRDRYPHYDLGAAEARLLRTARRKGAAPAVRRRAYGWSDPGRDHPLDAERARRDLKAACLEAVCSPRAGAQLASFLRTAHTDLAGAAVFGCLLHLAGLRDGARFWWQYAAGSGRAGTAPAAYCLFLDHSRRGEHHDAGVWARELVRRGFRPGGRRDLREVTLCAQAAVLRYVDQLDDPDLGPVPLPRPGLPVVLEVFRAPVPAAGGPAAGSGSGGGDGRTGDGGTAEAPAGVGPVPARAGSGPAAGSGAGGGRTGTGEALAEARRALAVVRVLEKHPLGVRASQLAREAALAEPELAPLLAMLCEEEYAYRPGAGVYARGPALDRLAAPGTGGLAGQLQRTLSLARDSAGAAVYLSRYADGEVRITQMADGPAAPPVREWVDFTAAAHASAVGKCLLTQLDPDGRRDHVARHRPARLTPRTITDSRALFSALDAVAPGAPVFDLREYSPGVVCSAVPIAAGAAAGSLALSLPASHAHRLHEATAALRRKAVPVLLALLLSGAIPPDAATDGDGADPAGGDPPADGSGAEPSGTSGHTGPAAGRTTCPGRGGDGGRVTRPDPAAAPQPTRVTAETLRHLRSLFRTPLVGAAAAAAAGPHLVSDPAAEAAYLFEAGPDGGPPRLALPRTFAPLTPGSLRTRGGLVVLGT